MEGSINAKVGVLEGASSPIPNLYKILNQEKELDLAHQEGTCGRDIEHEKDALASV